MLFEGCVAALVSELLSFRSETVFIEAFSFAAFLQAYKVTLLIPNSSLALLTPTSPAFFKASVFCSPVYLITMHCPLLNSMCIILRVVYHNLSTLAYINICFVTRKETILLLLRLYSYQTLIVFLSPSKANPEEMLYTGMRKDNERSGGYENFYLALYLGWWINFVSPVRGRPPHHVHYRACDHHFGGWPLPVCCRLIIWHSLNRFWLCPHGTVHLLRTNQFVYFKRSSSILGLFMIY